MNPHRILLVEDDPVSRAFLAEAASTLPARVDCAASIAEAVACVQSDDYDLWLVDAHLPDGSGAALLTRLRGIAPGTPALAHTASRDRAVLDALVDAGFAEVLAKPMSAEVLRAAMRRALGLALADPGTASPSGKLPCWDDARALAALNGELAHVQALRALFLDELPRQRARIESAARAGNGDAMRAELHRLQAGCGFVGAARLGDAVHWLAAEPASPTALQRFIDAAMDLRPD